MVTQLKAAGHPQHLNAHALVCVWCVHACMCFHQAIFVIFWQSGGGGGGGGGGSFIKVPCLWVM